MIWIGLDDTDTIESPGTGHLARKIAAALSAEHDILGVTRHQLLVDPRVPCTKNNSCAAIAVQPNGRSVLLALLHDVRQMMLADYQPGSDPGLCVAQDIAPAITQFGRRAQRELVSQSDARVLAATHGIELVGLGGDHGGVIGALAAVGLAAAGEDGRYVLVGHMRDLTGLQPVSALLEAGICAVQTEDGQTVTEGLVDATRLRPARRGGRPIAVVTWSEDHWLPLKLD
jgi:tRNA(Ile2) C34 agmatinyltransferase TiaS